MTLYSVWVKLKKKKPKTHRELQQHNWYTHLIIKVRPLTTCALYMCRRGPPGPPSAPRYPDLEPTAALSEASRRTEWWTTAVLLYNIPGRLKMPGCDSCSMQKLQRSCGSCVFTGCRNAMTYHSSLPKLAKTLCSSVTSCLLLVRFQDELYCLVFACHYVPSYW